MTDLSKQYLQIKISSPDKIIWDAPGSAISSYNALGDFDVLPGHANFITICVNADVTIYDMESEEHQFHFDRCAFYCSHNKVTIYTNV